MRHLIVAAQGAQVWASRRAKRSLVAAGRSALLRMPRRMPYHVVAGLALEADAASAEQLDYVNRLADPGSAVEWSRSSSRRSIAANEPAQR